MSIESTLVEKRKTITPKLRFKEFKEGIAATKLDELITFKSGGTPAKDDAKYWDGNIPWISAASMIGKYYSKSERTITELGLNNGSKLAPKGSLLLLVRGSMLFNKIPIGIAATDVAFNQDLKNLIPKANTIADYLYQWFSSKENLLLDKVVGTGIGAGKLDTEDLKNLNVYLPSLPEQHKIASFLSAVDEKIQQLMRKKELLEQYKKGVMQQLFSSSELGLEGLEDDRINAGHKNPKIHSSHKSQFRQLRFKDENGKPYPKWEWKNGNELFDSISDKNHNSDLPILAITQDQGAVPRDLINYQMSVTESSIASYKVVQKGDFIISLRTFQGGIEYSNYKGICSPAYNILRPSSEDVYREFYRYYLKTSKYIMQLQKNLEGIRDGKMISYKYFSEIKLPFPTKEEQQKIASFLTALDAKIEKVATQIAHTQTFKKGLLQQMFV